MGIIENKVSKPKVRRTCLPSHLVTSARPLIGCFNDMFCYVYKDMEDQDAFLLVIRRENARVDYRVNKKPVKVSRRYYYDKILGDSYRNDISFALRFREYVFRNDEQLQRRYYPEEY